MKAFNFLLIAATAVMMTMAACGNADNKAADENGPEYTSAYVCPMHCEGSGSAEPGQCPVCGMDYVMNEDHKADGHDHGDADGDAEMEAADDGAGDAEGEATEGEGEGDAEAEGEGEGEAEGHEGHDHG